MAARNVLFIVIDQLRADCLWGRLADAVPLPNLAALRTEAVSFTRHYSVVNPCGPSRASMLTGQYAMNHGAVRNGTPLPRDVPNIATQARSVGYVPLLYGYTDTAQDPRGLSPDDPRLTSYEEVMEGFDEAVEMRLELSLPWRADLIAKGYDVPPYPAIFRPQGALDGPALYSAADSDTAFLTDQFLRGLLGRPAGWFAHLTYIRPHPPLVAPAPYNTLVDRAALPAPVVMGDRVAEEGRHPFIAPSLAKTPVAAVVEGFADLQPTDAVVATLRAVYLGLAAEVDHHIGRVVAALKAAGVYDDTLLIVTADHGEMLGDHHAWGKSTFYDAAFHTPLIIRDPNHPAQFGARVEAVTESIDIAPTLLGWIGADVPDTMDGRSLAGFLAGQAGPWREYTYSELDFGDPLVPTSVQAALGLRAEAANLAVLRGPRYTLVHFNAGLPPLLFDHQGAGEMRDIAGDPEAAPVLLAMTRALLDHRMAHAGGRFKRTMITQNGAVRASKQAI